MVQDHSNAWTLEQVNARKNATSCLKFCYNHSAPPRGGDFVAPLSEPFQAILNGVMPVSCETRKCISGVRFLWNGSATPEAL